MGLGLNCEEPHVLALALCRLNNPFRIVVTVKTSLLLFPLVVVVVITKDSLYIAIASPMWVY